MSTLREEVERAMREAAAGEERLYTWEAVAVAVALIEKEHKMWGHTRNCTCCDKAKRPYRRIVSMPDVEFCHLCDVVIDDHPRMDERCAPLPGEETR